jgi:hypothetical protein
MLPHRANDNYIGIIMLKSRREFLATTSAALLASLGTVAAAETDDIPPGAPGAFGTAPPVGPEVTAATFAEAQKLVQIELTEAERSQAAGNWRESMAALYERRTGPRKVALNETVAPYSLWNPVLPGHPAKASPDHFVRSESNPGALPASDRDIAFAPVWKLSRWVQSRQLSSERLTHIYLDRIARFDPKLRCIITLTPELAIQQA